MGSNPGLDLFYLFFHSKLRQKVKKSMSIKPGRDENVKLQLINFRYLQNCRKIGRPSSKFDDCHLGQSVDKLKHLFLRLRNRGASE